MKDSIESNQSFYKSIRIRFQYGHESALGDFHCSNHLHPLFAFFLLLQKLPFPGNVPAVTFGSDFFPKGRDGRTGDDGPTDGPLNGDLEHLPGDFIFKPVADLNRPGPIPVDYQGKGIHLYWIGVGPGQPL